MDFLVYSCVVVALVGFGFLGSNDDDLGWGNDKNSSEMVACLVWMGLWMMAERVAFWVSNCGCGTRVGCLGFSDGIFFGFWTVELDDSRWSGVFGGVDIKGCWDIGIARFGFASDQSLISARRWRLYGFGVVNGSCMVTHWVWESVWFVGIGGGGAIGKLKVWLFIGKGLDGWYGLWTVVIAGFLEKTYHSMLVIPTSNRVVQRRTWFNE
jgi:hypothetical protein